MLKLKKTIIYIQKVFDFKIKRPHRVYKNQRKSVISQIALPPRAVFSFFQLLSRIPTVPDYFIPNPDSLYIYLDSQNTNRGVTECGSEGFRPPLGV